MLSLRPRRGQQINCVLKGLKKHLCAAAQWLLWRARRAVERCCAIERPPITHGSTLHFHALQLLVTACRARNRAIKDEAEHRAKGEAIVMVSDATAAVVLAAAATEAFINEFAETISVLRQNAATWNPSRITLGMGAAADEIFDLEFLRRSVLTKYSVAAKRLGKRIDKGSLLYQDFDRLIGLRNALMHIHPVRPTEAHSGEKIADKLAARGIAMKREPGTSFSWYDRVQTADLARWACASARAIILEVLDQVPPTPGDPLKFVQDGYRTYKALDSEDWT
jgi:hypothetical protein